MRHLVRSPLLYFAAVPASTPGAQDFELCLWPGGARGTRTPGPLLANRRQHVHSSMHVQVTVSGCAQRSSRILAGCCTFLLYCFSPWPARAPRRRVAGQSQYHNTARPSPQARTLRAPDHPHPNSGHGLRYTLPRAARIMAGSQPGHPGVARAVVEWPWPRARSGGGSAGSPRCLPVWAGVGSYVCSYRAMGVRRPDGWCLPGALRERARAGPGADHRVLDAVRLSARAAQERGGGPAGQLAVFCNAAPGLPVGLVPAEA